MRWLFGGDLHKREKDITTIEGYVKCCNAVERKLIDKCKELSIDNFVSMGDWFDKGYGLDVAAGLSDYDMELEFSRVVKGNFYGLIGNHIRLNMDSNPELHLIQPHPVYKSRFGTVRTEQIIKTPDTLRDGTVQISFMHHKKDVSDVLAYKPVREPWATYHIALFHTPSIVPSQHLVGTGFEYHASPNTKIAEALDGVDLAIVGDIHKPLGKFIINRPNGQTTMIVPGSLTNTDASEENRHSMVMLPLIDVDAESNVSIQFVNFDLMTNMLTFKRKNLEKTRDKLKSLRGKAVENLYEPEEIIGVISSADETYTSLNAFMKAQGYTDMDRQLIRQVLNDPEDLGKLIEISTANSEM